jgi:glycogen operon protein
MRRRFLTGKPVSGRNLPDISWHGIQLNKPLWDDPNARMLAFTLAGISENEPDLHMVLNMSDETLSMKLPDISRRQWCLAVDTSSPSLGDIIAPKDQQVVKTLDFKVQGQTVVVFENRDV